MVIPNYIRISIFYSISVPLATASRILIKLAIGHINCHFVIIARSTHSLLAVRSSFF
jgi:hypothetical protein